MLDLSHLNPPQREAARHGEGPLLVFAGAGSGKTRVITHRIARLVDDIGVAPWRIMAVTFTNKAAGEMRERLVELIGEEAEALWVGTFHATCARILRQNAELLGVHPRFTIYDDQDQRSLVKRILKDLGIDEKRHPAKAIAGRIQREKQEMRPPDQMEGDDPGTEIARKVYEAYEARLRAADALDFGDLIYRLVAALEANPAARRIIAGKWDYLLVDEFQDTNHAQMRLVQALGSHGNVCVVGDDDQCIYRWRGADRRNILDFHRHFEGATVIKLEQNYRSTACILRAAHAVIAHAHDREEKELWTDNPEGNRIVVVRTCDARDEANAVRQVAEDLVQMGEPLSSLAVFYRTHAQSRVLEEALREGGLSYRIVGGLRFYDRLEVKDLLGYLRVIENPADDVSLQRIINAPTRGIGKTTVDRLTAFGTSRGRSLWDAIGTLEEQTAIKGAARKKVEGFGALMRGLMAKREQGAGVAELAREVLAESGYQEALMNEGSVESESRLENLRELVGAMTEWEGRNPGGDLSGFLEDVTLEPVSDQESGEGDAITLMTVHAAKGLEFPVVVVTGMEDGMFPRKGVDPWDDPEELEEERRLAYVAMTRAEERLVLTHAEMRTIFGRTEVRARSRFIDEIDPDDIEAAGREAKHASSTTRGGPARGRGYGGGARSGGYGGGGYGRGAQRRMDFEPAPDPWDTPDAMPDYDVVDLPDGGALLPGATVRHAKFGRGTVIDVEQGFVPKASVRFDDVGVKRIAISHLTPA